MCTLAVFHRVFPSHPLVVAANRDEYLARPAGAPGLLRETVPRAIGGRDLVAGGTWLGLTETGLVVGMLNRRTGSPPDPIRRSRGQLCLDLLAAPDAAAAAAIAASEPAGRYNPFNLLVADRRSALVVTSFADQPPRIVPLDRGLHLLTNLDVDDPTCPRIAASHHRFAAAGDAFTGEGDVSAFVDRLARVLGDHTTPLDPRGPGSLCVHLPGYGTRSASVVLVGSAAGSFGYFHADGPPCRTPLAPVALPF
jgi:uncharacterized protein with NRDE domain